MVLTECMVLICKNLNSLQQVWLKLAQCILRRIFLNFINVFSLFLYYLPLEKDGTIHLNNLNPLYPRMFRAKFDWNWPSGSGEEDFKNFVNVFLLFLYLLPSKKGRSRSNVQKNWIPFTRGCFVPSLVITGPVVMEKKLKMWEVYRQTDGWMDGRTDDGKLAIRTWAEKLVLGVVIASLGGNPGFSSVNVITFYTLMVRRGSIHALSLSLLTFPCHNSPDVTAMGVIPRFCSHWCCGNWSGI